VPRGSSSSSPFTKACRTFQCRRCGNCDPDRTREHAARDRPVALAIAFNGYALSLWFSRLVKRYGLPRVRLHDLRHSFSALSIEAGVDLATLSRSLGHSSIRTTVDLYGHISLALQRSAAERLNSIIGAASNVASDDTIFELRDQSVTSKRGLRGNSRSNDGGEGGSRNAATSETVVTVRNAHPLKVALLVTVEIGVRCARHQWRHQLTAPRRSRPRARGRVGLRRELVSWGRRSERTNLRSW
jgi:hypothetical protein